MKLIDTPESLVPVQSVIDSWPKLSRKKQSHPCQDKCPNFTDEQCCYCLVQETADTKPDEQKYLESAIKSLEEVP